LERLERTELFLASLCKEIIKQAENEAGDRAGKQGVKGSYDNAYQAADRVVAGIEGGQECKVGSAIGPQDNLLTPKVEFGKSNVSSLIAFPIF
jgi:hypothetical protein